MLDLKYIRQNGDIVTQKLAVKGYDFDFAGFQALDERRKKADIESQNLQAERKSASKRVGQLISEGLSVDEAKAQIATLLDNIDVKIDGATQAAKQVQQEIENLLMTIPNLVSDDVPPGDNEADNQEILQWGVPRRFDFEPKDHVDLGEQLDQMSGDLGAIIAGSRFIVLSHDLARLQRALTQFMLDTHIEQHGYREVYVPYLVNRESLLGTGQLPKFEADLFKLETTPSLYLTPTAEVPVTNLLRNQILSEHAIAEGLRYVCHTPCFRSEAGSSGRDTRGMIRQHQFEKVELVWAVKPSESTAALETLTGHAEAILQALELPYRKVILCGGDLGFSAMKTYDLEVWLPGQSAYREISSCSNFGDYQARRLQARWRNPETGKPELVHTLNGSGVAVGRTLVAVLENYQEADGSIAIPQELHAYMGGKTHIGLR